MEGTAGGWKRQREGGGRGDGGGWRTSYEADITGVIHAQKETFEWVVG